MRKFLTLAAAAAAVMFGASAHAVPTLVVTLTDTGSATTFSCSLTGATVANTSVCSGAGWNFQSGFGNTFGNLEFNFQGTVGGYSMSFQTSQTNAPGVVAGAQINVGFTNMLNKSSVGSLVVSVAAHEFILPSGPAMTLFGSQALSSNTSNVGSIGSQYFASATNAAMPSLAPTASSSTSLPSNTAASVNAAPVNWMRNATPFSLENVLTFNLSQSSDEGINGTANLIVRNRVPEPMTTALVGLGLFGAAFFSRRRKAVTV